MFAVCWFPYSMVEMREFKNVAATIIQELVTKGLLGPTDLTKAVLETAAGIRMWQGLRAVSDAALYERLMKKPTIVGQGVPKFQIQSPLMIASQTQTEKSETTS
jgi:hypothetical protein